jgi:hypothetical protein
LHQGTSFCAAHWHSNRYSYSHANESIPKGPTSNNPDEHSACAIEWDSRVGWYEGCEEKE